jgi:hypothetical protein
MPQATRRRRELETFLELLMLPRGLQDPEARESVWTFGSARPTCAAARSG